MLPNRGSDQPASLLSSMYTHTHPSSLQDPVCVIQVCLCLPLYPVPAVQDCGACCQCDAQRAVALANSRDWLYERLSCHKGESV